MKIITLSTNLSLQSTSYSAPNCTWSSSNTSVATVSWSGNGKTATVTGKNGGPATITVTCGNKSATKDVKVANYKMSKTWSYYGDNTIDYPTNFHYDKSGSYYATYSYDCTAGTNQGFIYGYSYYSANFSSDRYINIYSSNCGTTCWGARQCSITHNNCYLTTHNNWYIKSGEDFNGTTSVYDLGGWGYNQQR